MQFAVLRNSINNSYLYDKPVGFQRLPVRNEVILLDSGKQYTVVEVFHTLDENRNTQTIIDLVDSERLKSVNQMKL